MFDCLKQLRPNVTLHVILACKRVLKQECGITFKRKGMLFINMGQVVRGLPRTQTAFLLRLKRNITD